jgi:hypothetical protein
MPAWAPASNSERSTTPCADVRAALDQAIDDALVHSVRVDGNDDARMVVPVETQSVQAAVGRAQEGEFIARMNVPQGRGIAGLPSSC